MISTIISAIVVGAIIGALGRLVVRGKQNISIMATIATVGGIDWIKLVIQVVLAAVGVWVFAGFAGTKARV